LPSRPGKAFSLGRDKFAGRCNALAHSGRERPSYKSVIAAIACFATTAVAAFSPDCLDVRSPVAAAQMKKDYMMKDDKKDTMKK
jgi:hypothetical protein